MIILLLVLLIVLATSLFANRLTTHRIKSNVLSLLLFLMIIFINQWVQEGSFNNAMMFFLYSLLALPVLAGGILFLVVFNDVIWMANQKFHHSLNTFSLLIIGIISIVLITGAFYAQKIILMQDDERIAKHWEMLPVCGPGVQTACKSS